MNKIEQEITKRRDEWITRYRRKWRKNPSWGELITMTEIVTEKVKNEYYKKSL